MVARASELFLPTLREPPADAEAASHKLLVRGGFIRQVGAGLWTFLPLGWRVHQKVVRIIREEIDAIGGQEMLEPVLTPAELWETSGRIGIPIVFKLKDRAGRDYVLPFSHEETMTFHARELQSYKQLPQLWYHFSTKERDEPRPRGGLLRVREFVMKDSYSFDRDEAGLDRSFEAHRGAYERIWERCGLEAYYVEAESGIMGGRESSGFMAPAESGENILVRCENGDYYADYDAARGIPRAPELPEPLDKPEEVETPGVTTIESLAEFLGIDLLEYTPEDCEREFYTPKGCEAQCTIGCARRASAFETSYVSAMAAPILIRNKRMDDALALLADVTAADAPPAYDVLVMNPFVKRLADDPRARDIVARSKAHFDIVLKAIADARDAGRFPRYLEQPLHDLLAALRN